MNPTTFWNRVSRPDEGCWLWPGARSGKYGSVRAFGRTMPAHRYAWTTINGEVPSNVDVCHSCDVPLCVRLSHLFLGTRADNMADAKAKGRLRDVHPVETRAKGVFHGRTGNPNATGRGSANVRAVMDEDDVQEVRRLLSVGWDALFIAGAFGVGRSTIQAIKSGQNWAWLP